MTDDITILLADDHPIFRQGLKQLIDQQPGLHVVAEEGDGRSALAAITELAPTVAVLDLDMPDLDGFAVAQQARDLALSTRIVILTMHNDELHFGRAIDLGVRGYVIKDGAATEAIDCIRAVAAGGDYVSPAMSSYLLRPHRRSAAGHPPTGLESLTPAERRVLSLLAELKTTRQIASARGISPRTVDNHRAHICAKLDLQGPHALTKFALDQQRLRR
jgi:DNA-binding NarL/FixJ family response regulator